MPYYEILSDIFNKKCNMKLKLTQNICKMMSPLIYHHPIFDYLSFKPQQFDNDTKLMFVEELNKSCEIYAFGTNITEGWRKHDGILGLGSNCGDKVLTPTLIETTTKTPFIDISCGDLHVIAIDENGVVYGWGNYNGLVFSFCQQYGEYMSSPRMIPPSMFNSTKAIMVCASRNRSCVLTADGKVWHLGTDANGNDVRKPTVNEELKDYFVKSIYMSKRYDACAVITNEDKCFVYGTHIPALKKAQGNRQACPGKLETEKPLQLQPFKLCPFISENGTHLAKIVYQNIKSCQFVSGGTLILTTDGFLYFLVIIYDYHRLYKYCLDGYEMLSVVDNDLDGINGKISDIACGDDHCLVITEKGKLYELNNCFKNTYDMCEQVWYQNESNRYDKRKKQNIATPNARVQHVFTLVKETTNVEIKSCHASANLWGAISITNQVYIWGKYDHENKSNEIKQCTLPFKYFSDKLVKDLEFGKDKCFVSVYSSKKKYKYDHNEEKENKYDESDIIINGRDEFNVNEVKNSTWNIFMKNESLFGHNKWLLVQKHNQQKIWGEYTKMFIQNLQLNNDGIIKVINYDKIDKRYHIEIINAKYLLICSNYEKDLKINEKYDSETE
eukprot:68665_1